MSNTVPLPGRNCGDRSVRAALSTCLPVSVTDGLGQRAPAVGVPDLHRGVPGQQEVDDLCNIAPGQRTARTTDTKRRQNAPPKKEMEGSVRPEPAKSNLAEH